MGSLNICVHSTSYGSTGTCLMNLSPALHRPHRQRTKNTDNSPHPAAELRSLRATLFYSTRPREINEGTGFARTSSLCEDLADARFINTTYVHTL